MRAWFSTYGIELASGIHSPAHDEPWSLNLQLQEVQRSGTTTRIARGSSHGKDNRIEIDHHESGISQWFENRLDALEQGFTIRKKPDGQGDEIALILKSSGTLKACGSAHSGDIAFVDRAGSEVVRYTGLKAWDAGGQPLAARMYTTRSDSITIRVSDKEAVYPITIDPLFANMEARLVQESIIGDEFGKAVALAGDTALVGSPSDDTQAGADAGSAYVFTRAGGTWTKQAKIIPSDGAANGKFGTVFALSPSSIMSSSDWQNSPIGLQSEPFTIAFKVTPLASGMNGLIGLASGDADWFDDLACTLRLALDGYFDAVNGSSGFQRVNPLPYVAGQEYSAAVTVNPATRTYSVTVDGVFIAQNFAFRGTYVGPATLDTLVVKNETGSHLVNQIPSNTALIGTGGKAYVFERAGNIWSFQAQLASLVTPAAGDFGKALALAGNTAIVGTGSNTAHVFIRSGSIWSKQDSLTGSGTAGYPVSILGNTAWVGGSNKVNVFTRSGLVWNLTNPVFLSSAPVSLSMSGDTGVVGMENSAQVFIRAGGYWTLQQTLSGSEGSPANKFGAAVSLSGNSVVIGAPDNYTTDPAPKGCAYVFARNNGTWSQERKFVAADGAKFEHLGSTVALSGTTALLGMTSEFKYWNGPVYEDTAPPGGAYVLERGTGNWNQEAKLTASDRAENDSAGKSVSISGNKAIVGAPDSDSPAGVNAGRAFVFTRSGSYWNQEANLTAQDGSVGGAFGYAVAISGDTALIGTPLDEESGPKTGAAYAFRFNGNDWIPQGKLLATDRSSNNNFGWSVALSGNTALIGSPADEIGLGTFAGSAYFFTSSGDTWSQQAKVIAPGGAIGDGFGWSVAISGDTAVIGAPAGEAGTAPGGTPGKAHLFIRDGTNWLPQTALGGTENTSGDKFGWSVALAGDTVLVGAPFLDFNLPEPSIGPGAAYVFRKTGNSWNTEAKLAAAGGVIGDVFGYSVAVSADTAIVGVPFRDSSTNRGGGLAYVFEKNGAFWNEQETLSAGVDADSDDWFGEAVAISGSLVIVGASRDQTVGPLAGSAYTFLLGELPAIISQPVSATVHPGESATFSIVAEGDGPLRYQWRRDGFWLIGATGSSFTIASALPSDEGYYDCVVSNTGGVVTSAAAILRVNALSELTRVQPPAAPSSQGFLIVNLTPSGVGGWRFTGEQAWRASGIPVGGLTTGDRTVEFMPVAGYIQPPPEPVGIVSGGVASFVNQTYYSTGQPGSGGLGVVLKPDSLAVPGSPGSEWAQWRLLKLGVNHDPWLNSGESISGLVPGRYLIECKPVEGRVTPPPINVTVEDGDASLATITYFLKGAETGAIPQVLPFETVTGSPNLPYAHVGQIRSDTGSSTGFVVKPRVVATAGHVVFDDGTLSVVTGLQWLFQRDSGSHEAVPLVPRGAYLLDDYAAARSAPGVQPGVGTLESQNRDAAALFFGQDAGRGGYSGYLASDATENEFITSSALKMLVGYPVDGSAFVPGRMHATPAMNAAFTRVPTTDAFGNPFRTYTTSDIRGAGGMSGGPLCVQFENGPYYPSAIFLGGDNQTVVRAIDSKVIDILTLAEAASVAGDNNTGGGITLSSFSSISGGSTQTGALKVTIQPAAARAAGAGWRIDSGSYYDSGDQLVIIPDTYTLQLSTVPGFQVPTSQSVTIKGGKLRELTFTYAAQNAAPTLSNLGNLTISEDSATGPLAVTLHDADDAETALVLTGTSSNTVLVPNSAIAFGGSGANRTVSITPAANQYGTATITLTVSDGSLTDTDTFTLTVNAVNDTPTITHVSNQTLSVNHSTTALPFTIGDIETSASSLTLGRTSSNSALLPAANILFGGTGANRTVTLSPAAGQLGSSSITLSVSDGTLTASTTFTLTVTGTTSETWRFEKFGTATNTGSAADSADPDHDGRTNRDEYAAGTDPNNAADFLQPATITRTGGTFTVTLHGRAQRSYQLQRATSPAATSWTSVATTAAPLPADIPSLTLSDPAPPQSRAFYRIQASAP